MTGMQFCTGQIHCSRRLINPSILTVQRLLLARASVSLYIPNTAITWQTCSVGWIRPCTVRRSQNRVLCFTSRLMIIRHLDSWPWWRICARHYPMTSLSSIINRRLTSKQMRLSRSRHSGAGCIHVMAWWTRMCTLMSLNRSVWSRSTRSGRSRQRSKMQ